MENPIKMDDLGLPLFKETPTYQKTKAYPWHHNCYKGTPKPGPIYDNDGRSVLQQLDFMEWLESLGRWWIVRGAQLVTWFMGGNKNQRDSRL